jgi:thiamine biosynthesis protein ThiS
MKTLSTETNRMRVKVNGENRDIEQDADVQTLLKHLGLQPSATVVERNGDILDRDRFEDTKLAEGDVLELVRLVGGG